MIVKAIKTAIGNQQITDEVSRRAISYACKTTGSFSPVCNALVGKIAKEIIERIRNKQDPFTVCYRM
jgi:hypothetical protein